MCSVERDRVPRVRIEHRLHDSQHRSRFRSIKHFKHAKGCVKDRNISIEFPEGRIDGDGSRDRSLPVGGGCDDLKAHLSLWSAEDHHHSYEQHGASPSSPLSSPASSTGVPLSPPRSRALLRARQELAAAGQQQNQQQRLADLGADGGGGERAGQAPCHSSLKEGSRSGIVGGGYLLPRSWSSPVDHAEGESLILGTTTSLGTIQEAPTSSPSTIQLQKVLVSPHLRTMMSYSISAPECSSV